MNAMLNIPVCYNPGFMGDPAGATLCHEVLWKDLAWERREGAPRFEYFCSHMGLPYTYGRGTGVRTYHPQAIHPLIAVIWQLAEMAANCKFEVCFLNGYQDQSDHLGWHADDSPEMDDARPIAIVSLGVEREIWFRRQDDKGADATQKLLLQNGSLCLMLPGMQETHFHRIPKAGHLCGRRISLTFRGYADPGAS